MNKVAIPQTEYRRLQRHADAYRKLAGKLYESVIRDPINDVLMDFRQVGLYTDEFLRDLEDGLRKSSYRKR